MSSEEFDNKAKEAAGQYHPPYNENAWGRMQLLLDEQLPQQEEKKRRGFIWLLPVALLIATGTWLAIAKPWQNKPGYTPPAIAQKQTAPQQQNNTVLQKPAPPTNSTPQENTYTQQQHTIAGITPFKSLGPRSRASAAFVKIAAPPAPLIIEDEDDITTKTDIIKNEIGKTNIPTDTPAVTTPLKTIPPVTAAEPAKKAAAKNKKAGDKWLLSISVGPDVSRANSSSTGTWRTLYGAGIGYSPFPRLLLRTGIYATNKVYSAGPDEYKPYGNLAYMPGYKLTNVAANCRVLQMPVTVSYSIPAGRKNNLLATAGIASVWMKKETYKLDYLSDYGNMVRSYTHEVSNQNRHLFSMLSLSAGYRYTTGRFSVIAEPYINLPLQGIGEGNIKLKSAGIQLSLTAKPFAKK